MSLVFANTRVLYKRAFRLEFFCIILASLLVKCFFSEQFISFVIGSLIAFIPQIAFIVYALYFKHQAPVADKAKVLYQSEGIKLVLTIILFAFSFSLLQLKPLGLFVGYFIFIILNNLLPTLLNLKN